MSAGWRPDTHLDITVTLLGIEPPIWRRLHVPLKTSFARLHAVLQAAFGWKDCHLHEFVVGGLSIGSTAFDKEGLSDHQTLDATGIMLHDLRLRHRETLSFDYIYDFGDDWQHRVVVNGGLVSEEAGSASLCIAGARSAPPEDVGGPPGYEDFLAAWKSPKHPEHGAVRRWAGRSFDPERFDLEKVNKSIRAASKGPLKGAYLVQ